jgi:peptidoglycan hydrolase CwlO-like protein
MLDRQSLAELADMYKEKYNLALKDNEELERQIDEVNAEVEQLRKQRDDAMDRLAQLDEEIGL